MNNSRALATAVSALTLIASPRRPDGTYNRDRAGVEQMAAQALQAVDALQPTVGTPALDEAISALSLIASPARPDGTYNRDRRACELLAREALRAVDELTGTTELMGGHVVAESGVQRHNEKNLPSADLPVSRGNPLEKLDPAPRCVPANDAPLVVYTDGASKGNPGPSAWGAVVLTSKDGKPSEVLLAEGGFIGEHTNQVAELMAVLEGLRRTPKGAKIILVSDSKYALDGTSSWRKGWARNGWLTADKQPVKNKEVWEAIAREADARQIVEFRHVRGHSGEPWNELTDQLANEAVAARGPVVHD